MSSESAALLWINQSNLFWSRLQTVSAIEAGTLAAVYTLWNDKHKIILILISILAIWLLCLVGLLMTRDEKYLKLFEAPALIKRPDGILKGRDVGYLILFSLMVINFFIVLITLASFCFCPN